MLGKYIKLDIADIKLTMHILQSNIAIKNYCSYWCRQTLYRNQTNGFEGIVKWQYLVTKV